MSRERLSQPLKASAPIRSIAGAKLTISRLLHPLNAQESIIAISLPKSTSTMPLQPANANSRTCLTELGITMPVRFLQFSNMWFGIHSTPSEIVRVVNSVEPANAFPSVLQRAALKVTSLIFSHPENVLPYNIERSRGIFKVVRLVQLVKAPFLIIDRF